MPEEIGTNLCSFLSPPFCSPHSSPSCFAINALCQGVRNPGSIIEALLVSIPESVTKEGSFLLYQAFIFANIRDAIDLFWALIQQVCVCVCVCVEK